MTQHSTSFEIDRPVPAATVKELLPDAHNNVVAAEAVPAVTKKFNLRKVLMAGAAVAVLAGARNTRAMPRLATASRSPQAAQARPVTPVAR